MDVVTLSRLQFALTISYHYVFPPMTIGLGIMLVLLEGLWLKTKRPVYHQAARFWTHIFALTFAMGVATGIVMEFEFGTNWAAYSRFVGDVFGSALAAEGIFAFFLESGFLALLLFGWNRVSPRMHFFATCMVCLGSLFSAIWIVVANSWMQTPAGYRLVGEGAAAHAQLTAFWNVVFNPSSTIRLGHVLCGAAQAGAFLVVSVGAFYWLRNRHSDFAKASLKVGLWVGLGAALLQLYTGDQSGKVVARHQASKLAAMEGLFETTAQAHMHIVGWVNEEENRVEGSVSIPGLLSWLAFGNVDQPVTGLDAFPRRDWPMVNLVFQTFHFMVGIGLALILLSALGLFFYGRGTLGQKRWMLILLVLSVLGPTFANQLGWATAEVGRQPWIVYGIMRTSDGVSEVVAPQTVLTSIVLFTVIYMLLFAVFVYLLNNKIQQGPEESDLRPGGKRDLPEPEHP